MPQFSVNTHRFDPYRNFKFKVKWENEYVAGLNKCGALTKSTELVEWWEAGDLATSRKLPGKTTYNPITLEAGVTHDTNFENWANKVNNYEGAAAMSLKDFRKDVVIDIFNLQGAKVLSYKAFNCWVSEYTAIPDLDAAGSAVMIQSLTLQNEGWERDTSVSEPAET